VAARKSDGRAARRKSVFKGIAVVPGIAMGQVHLKFRQSHSFSDRTIEAEDVAMELERLQEAVRMSKEQLMVSRAKIARDIGEVEATIFDTHIALLEDRSFLGKIKVEIERDLKPGEVVVSEIVEGYYQALSMVADENIRERAADIRDVGRRLLDNMATLGSGDAQQMRLITVAILCSPANCCLQMLLRLNIITLRVWSAKRVTIVVTVRLCCAPWACRA